jgi:hypothetical protein
MIFDQNRTVLSVLDRVTRILTDVDTPVMRNGKHSPDPKHRDLREKLFAW